MKFLTEFKAFITKGSAIDMAIGLIVGTAFSGMVKSLVDNVLMPPLGLLIGGVDFSNLFITLKSGPHIGGPYHTLKMAQEAGAITLNIGLFINTLISLVIVGFVVFVMVKMIARFRHVEVVTKPCPECCTEIPINAKRCPNCTSNLDV